MRPRHGFLINHAQAARGALFLALKLQQDRLIFQGGGILRDSLAAGDGAQQAPHDLARASLGQIVGVADIFRLGDVADLFAKGDAE